MVKLMSTSERKLCEAPGIPPDYHPTYLLVRGKRNLFKKRSRSLESLAALMETRINVRV